MQTVLAVHDARKAYGGTRALDGASVSLHQGEWLALLGPNGAGKTTLIRAITGRVQLDTGSITLLNASLDGNAVGAHHARARLGIVPQELALYPLLTARGNLQAFASLQGVVKSDLHDRVKWALDWTGLVDRADSLVKTFSGGMKRRLNIACGVLHNPEVVLLDEPTVGVDPQSRERIWSMLAELRSGGASLLLTTHQLDEAQQVCDRIAIIDHGKTIAQGTLDELVSATIGRGKQLTIVLEAPLPAGSLNGSVKQDGARVQCTVRDVASELPQLLEKIGVAGGKIVDVHVEQPSLHAVFLHLTGRELRE